MEDRKFDSGGKIRKRTPLEQAIAEKTDRRARYAAKRRSEGFKHTNFWVREDCLPEVRAFIQMVNERGPQEPTS